MHRWARFSLLLVVAISTGCGASGRWRLVSLEDALVYQPTRYPEGEWKPPGLDYQDAWFTSADETKLHGWYCPVENPRAVVLVAHGNAGNLSHRWGQLRLLQQKLGVSAMMFDYRGYGRSDGVPSEEGLLADARAARKWLAYHAGVAPEEIVLMGRSLGGGVMVDLAADGARGLILESTFTSLPDVAAARYPLTPVRYAMRNRFDSVAKIGMYRGPLLQFHGEADPLVPLEQAQELFAAAGEPKQFVTLPDAGHNWLPTIEYVQKLDQFFNALPPTGAEQDR